MGEYSLNLINSLRDSKERVSVLREQVQSADLVSDSMHLSEIFSTVRKELLEAADYLGLIAQSDPMLASASEEESTYVQNLATKVQRNLLEARKNIDKTGKESVIPVTEKSRESFLDLGAAFVDFVGLYNEEVRPYHVDFKSLDLAPVKTGMEFGEIRLTPVFREAAHRVQGLMALERFARVDAPEPNLMNQLLNQVFNQENGRYIDDPKTHNYDKYAAQFQKLTDAVIPNRKISELTIDIEEVIALQEEGHQVDPTLFPDLQEICDELSLISKNIKYSVDDVAKMLTDPSEFKNGIKKITTVAQVSRASLGQVAKTVLTLRALRLLQLNQTQDGKWQDNSRTAELKNDLADNDAASNVDSLLRLIEITAKETDRLETGILIDRTNIELMQSNDPILTFEYTPRLSKVINTLRRELIKEGGVAKALEEKEDRGSTATRMFVDANWFILGRAGIDDERLKLLDRDDDNTELVSILQDISKAAQRYNNVDAQKAAELIYLMSRTFGKFRLLPVKENNENLDDLTKFNKILSDKIEFQSNNLTNKGAYSIFNHFIQKEILNKNNLNSFDL